MAQSLTPLPPELAAIVPSGCHTMEIRGSEWPEKTAMQAQFLKFERPGGSVQAQSFRSLSTPPERMRSEEGHCIQEV